MSCPLAGGSRLAAIGTWSSRLLIVTVPELKVIADHDLATTVIPRSTLFMDIGDERALLLGMGDGQLSHWRVRTNCAVSVYVTASNKNRAVLTYIQSGDSHLHGCQHSQGCWSPGMTAWQFCCSHCALFRGHHAQAVQIGNDGSLSEHKVVSIGVKPLSLSAFSMAGVPYVFAATDRPAVVYARNGKLVYSPVNEQDVTMLCSFSTDAFPGAIAMAKDDCLMIAQIDAIQKLHIRCALRLQRCWPVFSPAPVSRAVASPHR